MTTKEDFERIFPLNKQVGGAHYTFTRTNNLNFFQGNVIKYVCRYKEKNGIQDLQKIIHYCELEIQQMREEEK
jgi:hypothetical protein